MESEEIKITKNEKTNLRPSRVIDLRSLGSFFLLILEEAEVPIEACRSTISIELTSLIFCDIRELLRIDEGMMCDDLIAEVSDGGYK